MQSERTDDPYAVLGVPRTVTPDELKRAYRKLSMTWHPDRHAGESDGRQAEAERRFKLINAAYVAIGELLRTGASGAPVQPAGVAAQTDSTVVKQSDARVDAIRAVVASAALRMVPNLPRHSFRRVTDVVEQILLDTIAVGDRAFAAGFDAALRDAMYLVGMDTTLRAEALSVLDAAADDLQWRGRGADPQTWQTLLRPLEKARGKLDEQQVATRSVAARPQGFSWDSLLRPEPLPMVGQSALAILAVLLLLPMAPLGALLRLVLLLVDLGALAYLTFQGRL